MLEMSYSYEPSARSPSTSARDRSRALPEASADRPRAIAVARARRCGRDHGDLKSILSHNVFHRAFVVERLARYGRTR